jgi:hypothetical protein
MASSIDVMRSFIATVEGVMNVRLSAVRGEPRLSRVLWALDRGQNPQITRRFHISGTERIVAQLER